MRANLFGLTLLVVCLGYLWWERQPQRIMIYGRDLHVGGKVPALSGNVADGPDGDSPPTPGRFHVVFAGLKDPLCADDECPSQASVILERGGHVEILDEKGSTLLGLPIIHDGVEYSHADALMIVTDAEATILALYRNVTFSDVDLALGVVDSKAFRPIDRLRHGLTKTRLAIADPLPLVESLRERFR